MSAVGRWRMGKYEFYDTFVKCYSIMPSEKHTVHFCTHLRYLCVSIFYHVHIEKGHVLLIKDHVRWARDLGTCFVFLHKLFYFLFMLQFPFVYTSK